MKIGDRVRFLNQTGGGIVVGFKKKGWVTVEDEDGFEIPVPEKECVVVEENAAATEKKSIQTKDGEKLNVALAYSKAGAGFVCSIVNECNYNMLVTYTVSATGVNQAAQYSTMYAGEILPYERKEMFKFGKEELNDFSKRVLVRLVPFKRGTGIKKTTQHTLKPVVEKDFILDPMNLLKDGMYKENDYTPDKAYIIALVNENVKELPLLQNDDDQKLRQALKEKFQGEAETSAAGGAGNNPSGRKDTAGKAFINGKWIEVSKGKKEDVEEKALIKTSSNGILEVDLHATALLETTVGMDNTAILKYQMEKFNEAMKAVLRKKGQRIVFIHGKGDGVLRKAILTELKTKYPACRWQDASFKEYGYGATMVTV
jgi:hypothetical protein